jgi:hypothetical protein
MHNQNKDSAKPFRSPAKALMSLERALVFDFMKEEPVGIER